MSGEMEAGSRESRAIGPTNSGSRRVLEGKVTLVTGAGRGIGASAAELFASEGARVVLTSRTERELRDVVERIRSRGGQAEYVVADLSERAGIADAVDETMRMHGRLDLAFNNAGMTIPPAPLVEIPEEDFDTIVNLNFKSMWRSIVAEVRAIRATTGPGAIVCNSSVGSLQAVAGLGAYGATKRAVNSLTHTAAIEYGPEGIRVNAIAPGATRTEMMQQWEADDPGITERLGSLNPLRRVAAPVEIAQAALWLLSDSASYVTGVVLPVDGGRRA